MVIITMMMSCGSGSQHGWDKVQIDRHSGSDDVLDAIVIVIRMQNADGQEENVYQYDMAAVASALGTCLLLSPALLNRDIVTPPLSVDSVAKACARLSSCWW